jgi:Na+/H+-dicarboxylate symporter
MDRVPSAIEIEEDADRLADHPPKSGIVNHLREEHEENEPANPAFSTRFQLLATGLIIGSALTGTLLGVILSLENANEDLVSWIALPGDLFIRALKCIVLPLVFVNVILAVMQMAEAGKAGTVGSLTVLVYLGTTLAAALEGLAVVFMFQSLFSEEDEAPAATSIGFLCPTEGFVLVQEESDVFCRNSSEINLQDAAFEIDNVNRFFTTVEDLNESPSFSETLQDNIFKQLIPENIVNEFANGGFVGVVMFGIIFGAAAQALNRKPVLLLELLEDVNDILINIIEWIILLTPFAVISLIAGALGSQEDLESSFRDVGIFTGAIVVADAMHILIVYPIAYYLIIRQNPFSYYKFLFPAQVFAFSTASSAATLPMTMRCVKNSGQVPDSVRDFVLPIGATLNMDGGALYFPSALVFLATAAGIETSAADYFLILIVSSIGSAGAAPIPNAGIILLLTAFGTVYGGDTPSSLGLLFGIDWLVDRMQTVMNITGDALVARIVTHLAKIEVVAGRPTSFLNVNQPVKTEI